jgi:hypothetical protein
MKRDMELLRAILFYFEKRESDGFIVPQDIIAGEVVIVDGYDGRLVSDHVDVMYEGSLLEEVKLVERRVTYTLELESKF